MTEQVPSGAKTGFHVHHAICAVKKRLAMGGGITKDRKAPDQIGGYAFRGIDDADNVLCELTADAGIVLYPRVISHKSEKQVDSKGRVQHHILMVLEIDIVSAIDGSKHTVCTVGEGIDTGDKGVGKATSNAYKIAVFRVFQIPTHGENVEEYATQMEPAYQHRESNAGLLGTVPNPPPPPPPSVPDTQPEEPKPGPAKARARKPKADPIPIPAEGTPIPEPEEALKTIEGVNTFPLLFAVAQDVDATEEPGRSMLFAAIKDRAATLFAKAQSVEEVKEGFALVKAMGEPQELRKAANEAYVRFRNGAHP